MPVRGHPLESSWLDRPDRAGTFAGRATVSLDAEPGTESRYQQPVMQGKRDVSAHLISQVEVLDAEAWENYRARAAQVIAEGFGGRYLVRGARAEVIEADWPVEEPPPQTVIVAEFPSMKLLKGLYASAWSMPRRSRLARPRSNGE